LDRGIFGENLAVKYLEKKGYKILCRNFRTKFSEIDIIAETNTHLIFVEVKYRTNKSYGRAEDSISDRKIGKLEAAAKIYINNFYKGKRKNFQIDAVAINNFDKLEINHYKNITGG